MLCCFRILYKSCVIVEFNFGRVLFHDFSKVHFYNIIFEKKFSEKKNADHVLNKLQIYNFISYFHVHSK